MSSTISGFASVVVFPTSAKLEITAITLRMIFRERVLGISETIQTFFGRVSPARSIACRHRRAIRVGRAVPEARAVEERSDAVRVAGAAVNHHNATARILEPSNRRAARATLTDPVPSSLAGRAVGRIRSLPGSWKIRAGRSSSHPTVESVLVGTALGLRARARGRLRLWSRPSPM